jgi:hypothetical protein
MDSFEIFQIIVSALIFAATLLSFIFGLAISIADREIQWRWAAIALFGITYFVLLIGDFWMHEIKTTTPISGLVIQEFQSKVEYRTQAGDLVYSLTDIGEYNYRKNITGFTKIHKTGWGPDMTRIEPIFEVEKK